MARPGETVDQVTRTLLSRNSENVIVVEDGSAATPVGVARAADILRLRPRAIEEEMPEQESPGTPAAPGAKSAPAHSG